MNNIIFELKEKLNENGVIISFTGPFSQGIIEELGYALKQYLKDENYSKGVIYKIFSVFIEQTQNTKNYAFSFKNKKEKEEIISSGIMIIGYKNDKYFIYSGNLIKNEDVAELKGKLDKINKMNSQELKKTYRKKLRENIKVKNGGAGLGLLEIAKQSNSDLEYSFVEQGETYCFYTLIVYI